MPINTEQIGNHFRQKLPVGRYICWVYINVHADKTKIDFIAAILHVYFSLKQSDCARVNYGKTWFWWGEGGVGWKTEFLEYQWRTVCCLDPSQGVYVCLCFRLLFCQNRLCNGLICHLERIYKSPSLQKHKSAASKTDKQL